MSQFPAAWNVVHRESLPSTMDECRKLVTQYKSTVVIAKAQTGGRGRRGNQWVSPEGGFYATFGWVFPKPLHLWSGLSLAVGVSLLNSLELEGADVRLKWPNDLVHMKTRKKIGGVLIELAEKEGRSTVLVGIGINCKRVPFEDAISLEELFQTKVAPTQILQAIAEPLEGDIAAFSRIGFGAFQDRWLEVCAHTGKEVAIQGEKNVIKGHFQGIERDGTLLLNTAAGIQRIQSGHVLEW